VSYIIGYLLSFNFFNEVKFAIRLKTLLRTTLSVYLDSLSQWFAMVTTDALSTFGTGNNSKYLHDFIQFLKVAPVTTLSDYLKMFPGT
jgi:hypothetical protein